MTEERIITAAVITSGEKGDANYSDDSELAEQIIEVPNLILIKPALQINCS